MPYSGYYLMLLSMSFLLVACSGQADKDKKDKLPVTVAVDETFRPIIAEQFKVFDSSFPDLQLRIQYKSESACLNDFFEDSATLILVTRPLTAEEEQYCADKKMVPTQLILAKDAIAVVVNSASSDTFFSMSRIKGMLTGKYPGDYILVFDHQGSSTVRYMTDSLLLGEMIDTGRVFAAGRSDSVLAYVARNPGAIGFVGVSYVADYSDPAGIAFVDFVKIAAVYNDTMEKYYLPYQAYIAPGWYPLTRNLYYIHRETVPGAGTGFANFLSRERGQLIFKQARLFPMRTNIIFREAGINPSPLQ